MRATQASAVSPVADSCPSASDITLPMPRAGQSAASSRALTMATRAGQFAAATTRSGFGSGFKPGFVSGPRLPALTGVPSASGGAPAAGRHRPAASSAFPGGRGDAAAACSRGASCRSGGRSAASE